MGGEANGDRLEVGARPVPVTGPRTGEASLIVKPRARSWGGRGLQQRWGLGGVAGRQKRLPLPHLGSPLEPWPRGLLRRARKIGGCRHFVLRVKVPFAEVIGMEGLEIRRGSDRGKL